MLMDSGERCVMMDGITLMHKLFAGKWDMTQVVSLMSLIYSEFGKNEITGQFTMHGKQ